MFLRTGKGSLRFLYGLLLMLFIPVTHASSGVWITQGMVTFVYLFAFLSGSTIAMVIYMWATLQWENDMPRKRLTLITLANVLLLIANVATYIFLLEYIMDYEIFFIIFTLLFSIATLLQMFLNGKVYVRSWEF